MKTILSISILFFCSCNSFLDKKSDIHLSVPNKLEDAVLLLNDYTELNSGFPIYGDLGSDDFYVTNESWVAASSLDQRNAYIWADEPYIDAMQWQRPYKTVYTANQAIGILANVDNQVNLNDYKRTYGTAHFYRAFSFLVLTEQHCPAYVDHTAANELGIPLRLNAGIDEPSKRSSLKDTYKQIVEDFKVAAANLPRIEPVIGRPSKAAAFAALARTYLNMGNFEDAYLYADSCLQLAPELMNFNSLNASDDLPIPRFNIEVLFSANSVVAGLMGLNVALVDEELYSSYDDNDLRRTIFFKSNSTPFNSHLYKGNYDKNMGSLFIGLTTSEVYLIKAEAACRINKINDALASLNILLKSRWDENALYIPIAVSENEVLLRKILEERRKELLFRGRRWSDLKRLNLDSRFQKTLVRNVGSNIYKLEPNSGKYAYRLPESVIEITGMPQNKR